MKKSCHISASLMCCNILRLEDELRLLDAAACDSFHIDIMDGRFVRNFALNFYEIEAIRKVSRTPLDIHLMLEKPSLFLEKLIEYKPECITYHVESMDDITNLLHKTKQAKIQAGIAIDCHTSVDSIPDEQLKMADKILVMSVSAGFAGQSFNEQTFNKICSLKKRIDRLNLSLTIQVDGAINQTNIPRLYQLGASAFVLGSSGLFKPGTCYTQQVSALKASVISSS